MTVLAPKTGKSASSRAPNASGLRTIVIMTMVLAAAIAIQNRMRPARDDVSELSPEREPIGNAARRAFASSGGPAPFRDSTIRIESREALYIAPRPPPPSETGYGVTVVNLELMEKQTEFLRKHAASAPPDSPFAATEEDIESLRRHGSPLTW